MGYRIFDHTADLGVEVTGATLEKLYAGAAFALFDLLTDLSSVRAGRSREFDVLGENPADLLVNFLREILYAWNGEGFLMKSCFIRQITPTRLRAVLRGEGFDPARHPDPQGDQGGHLPPEFGSGDAGGGLGGQGGV